MDSDNKQQSSISSQVNTKYNKIEILIVAIMFIVVSFSNSGNIIARSVLYFVFIGAIILLPILRKRIYLLHSAIIRASLILIAYNLIIIVYKYESYTSVYNGLLYSASIMFFISLIAGKYKIDKLDVFTHYLSSMSKMLILINIFFRLIQKTIGSVSSTSFIFLFLYFIYLDKKTTIKSKVAFTGIWVLTAILAEERTFLLLVPIFMLLLLSWDKLIKKRFKNKLLFILFGTMLFAIPVFYVWLSESSYAFGLNEYALKYTGSRFFSGRDLIWSHLLDYYFDGNIFIGGGHHISPAFVFGDVISSHNTYLTILTRTGLIGAFLFVNFLVSIWNKFFQYRHILAVKLSGIFFIVSLLKQSSELSLISNNIALSIMNWLVLAYGLMYTSAVINEERRKSE